MVRIGVRLTYEQAKEAIEREGYKLLSTEYINSSTKLEVQCPVGHTYPVTLGKFKTGRRCPYCSNRVKITREDVETHLELEGYTLISVFTNSNNNMNLICLKGHEWTVNYQDFKNGRRCSKCSNRYVENKKDSTQWNTSLVKSELEKHGYSLIGEYVNSTTKIKIICPKGHITNKYYGHFLKGHLCKECSFNWYTEELRLEAKRQMEFDAESDGYTILSDYVDTHTDILMLCRNGHYTKRSPANFRKRVDCKGCMMSSYEQIVYRILHERYSYIINEYVHPKLRNKRFDFAIMDSEFEKVLFLVEVDGEGHFKDNLFGDTGSLEWNKRRDKEKDDFCSQENIPLIRVPYFKLDKKWIIEQLDSVEKYID